MPARESTFAMESPAKPKSASRTKASSTLSLLAAARESDPETINELFRRLLPRVRKIVALRIGCRARELEDREDVIQETLLDAFRSMRGFEARGEGALCHWLSAMVQNNLVDRARHRRARKRDERRLIRARSERSTVLTDSVLGDEHETPSKLAAAAEMERRIETAMLALEERHRRAIELRKLCELSFEEIAGELGLSTASSARSLYSRAMAELAKRL